MPRDSKSAAMLVLVLTAVLVAGCGISFGNEESGGTELFKSLEVGPAVANQPTTIVLKYAQQYPVKIEVKCDLLSDADIPTDTPPATETPPLVGVVRTPEPTLPAIPRVRPTPTNKVMEIFGTTLEANPNGGPVGTATPELGMEERRFRAPAAGEYTVWCYTPADENNAIFEPLTVSPD